MNRKLRFLNPLLVPAVLLLMLAAGCKKDKEEIDNDTAAVAENAAVDAAFDDVSGIADEASSGSVQSYRSVEVLKVMTTCAAVTIDTSVTPRLITIDFGTANCLGMDGNYRRGKILVTYTGAYRDSGSVHSISFDNYFVNDNQLQGTKTVTNNGRNSNGKLNYTVQVNGSILWSSGFGGGMTTCNSTRTRVWMQGESTPAWTDDIYLISGSASGVTRSGLTYTMQIDAPLKKEIGFRHFTEGVIAFTPGTKATRFIDFSYLNGARDNLARVTIKGVTFNIQLK